VRALTRLAPLADLSRKRERLFARKLAKVPLSFYRSPMNSIWGFLGQWAGPRVGLALVVAMAVFALVVAVASWTNGPLSQKPSKAFSSSAQRLNPQIRGN
jgi:hypothetical protein